MWLEWSYGRGKNFYGNGSLTSAIVMKVARMSKPANSSRSGIANRGLILEKALSLIAHYYTDNKIFTCNGEERLIYDL